MNTDFLETILFSINDHDVLLWQVLGFGVAFIVLAMAFWLTNQRILPYFLKKEKLEPKEKKRLGRIISLIFLLLFIISTLLIFKIDVRLFVDEPYTFKVSKIFIALLIIQFARLSDWVVSKLMVQNYYARDKHQEKTERSSIEKDSMKSEGKATRTIQYVVYILSAIFIIRFFHLENTNFDLPTPDQNINLSASNILTAILIIFLARLFAWGLIQLILYRYYKRGNVNIGSQYAINQLLKYIIYILGFLLAFDQLGIQMTLVWGGAAALLVGVGLGLQQTFNDLISGIILLFERTVEVEDVVDIDGLVGKVKKIGLRTSLVETIDNITVIVPNSKLIVDNVINWSHFDTKARFNVTVGVAYGSDTALIKKLLIRVANENVYVINYPKPIIRFVDFGDSALVFELHFWTRNLIIIEDIKSDLRFEIDRVFREENVTIPFPQRVVWQGNDSEGGAD